MAKRVMQLAMVQQRGRPVSHVEPWEKTTVLMLDRHAAYLDVVSVLVRLKHHKAIARAEIIRALVEFMIRSNIDFAQFATAEEMTTFLVSFFGRIPNSGRLPLLLESSLFHPGGAAGEEQYQDRIST
jgi:hypothetical protein